MGGRGVHEHSQEIHSPKQKAVRQFHQLDGETVPLFIKQILADYQAAQGDGHWECSLEQVRCALPTALASQRIRDHFAQALIRENST